MLFPALLFGLWAIVSMTPEGKTLGESVGSVRGLMGVESVEAP